MKKNKWRRICKRNCTHNSSSSYLSTSDVVHYNWVLKLRVRGNPPSISQNNFNGILYECICPCTYTFRYINTHLMNMSKSKTCAYKQGHRFRVMCISAYSNFHNQGLIFIKVPWRDKINWNQHLIRSILTG